jgi:hypothetical protein
MMLWDVFVHEGRMIFCRCTRAYTDHAPFIDFLRHKYSCVQFRTHLCKYNFSRSKISCTRRYAIIAIFSLRSLSPSWNSNQDLLSTFRVVLALSVWRLMTLTWRTTNMEKLKYKKLCRRLKWSQYMYLYDSVNISMKLLSEIVATLTQITAVYAQNCSIVFKKAIFSRKRATVGKIGILTWTLGFELNIVPNRLLPTTGIFLPF